MIFVQTGKDAALAKPKTMEDYGRWEFFQGIF